MAPPRSSQSRGRGRRLDFGRRGLGRARPLRLDDEVPMVYQDMLAEAEEARSAQASDGHDRAVKRRRVGERRAEEPAEVIDVESGDDGGTLGATAPRFSDGDDGKRVQTVYDLDASEESDMEWEDVEFPSTGIEQETQQQGVASLSVPAGDGDDSLRITLEKHDVKGKQRAVPRRKPVTGQEKKRRLAIHKTHLLCLLSHVQMRNLWCNDDEAQSSLERILPKHTVMCLNPKQELEQFTRSTTFADGLKQASETFKRRFKITAPGMRRPYWLDPSELNQNLNAIPDSAEILVSKDDFRKHAQILQGSRDLGAQLFCAMLRAVGVETRLVCSLQVLPFTGVAKGPSPRKPAREYIVLSEDDVQTSAADTSNSPAIQSSPTPPQRVRRLGQPRFTASAGTTPTPTPRPRQAGALPLEVPESSYPVFWVEAFNEAMQRWVAVDPIVTNTIAKNNRFEPPASDRSNNMSYVIAYGDDASARDVTKRYVKSFNSKTRKTRVESTKDGESWWERTMQFFERPFLEDKDQLEIGELTAKTAGEMMPRNIQDFKDHPIYALERHLRRNEVIHPKREIGKVALSKNSANKKNQPLEPVYRRADVHILRSADGWYRHGREVKVGEQPLKRVAAPQRKFLSSCDDPFGDDDVEERPSETPMYALFQTEVYKPPPIVDNRVPRNGYGNIDVYTPHMIPPGGFHLQHPEAARAARILGIDYADAVTGFKFKGRHGTASIEGIVASVQYREALNVVIGCLEDEQLQAELDRRTAEALRMWKMLLLKLRVAERVRNYTFEGEHDEVEMPREEDVVSDGGSEEGGGFLPEDSEVTVNPSNTLPPVEYEDDMLSQSPVIPGGDFDVPDGIPDQGSGSAPAQPIRALNPRASQFKSNPASRYTLIVVPREQLPPEKPKLNVPLADPPSALSQSSNLSGTVDKTLKETNANKAAEPARQSEPAESAVPKPAGITSSNPISVSSNNGSRAISADAPSGVPDLVHEQSDDSEIDQSDMISHDPEDEDAEPEWLLSD